MPQTSDQRYEVFYVLRFTDLFVSGRGFAFPCDAEGRVDVDNLSARSRENYLHACTVVGRDLAAPIVTLVSAFATRYLC